jgi:nitrogen fixation-related uncharacterized protein
MRLIALHILLLVGLIGCGSVVKETGKGIVSSVVEDFDEYDLSDATDEALAIGKSNGTSSFTYVGLTLFAVGAVSFAFFARDAGIKLMVCGALSGSVPYIVQSQYFSIIVNVSIGIVLLIGIWHFWWKVKQSEQTETADHGEEQKP